MKNIGAIFLTAKEIDDLIKKSDLWISKESTIYMLELLLKIYKDEFGWEDFVKILKDIIQEWHKYADLKFKKSEYAESFERPTGERFVFHGGMNIFNCAQDLKHALDFLLPFLLSKKEGDQQ